MSTPREVVLVTGATGFVGAAVVLEAIRKGYSVKGLARSQAKADAFVKKHPGAASHLQWTIVPDIAEPGVLEKAVDGVDYIIHVASPVDFTPEDNIRDLLRPAVQGTTNILKAALGHKRVKHIVITSSIAAILDMKKGMRPGYNYTHEDWNPVEWEEALASSGPFVYCASKKFAEKAAWDFVATETPQFALTTICPPIVLGPQYQPLESMDRLNETSLEVWELISGKVKEIPSTKFPVWTDVRDVAKVHVASLSEPKAKNQRYLISADYYSTEKMAYFVAQTFPEQASRIPPSDNSSPAHYTMDSSKAEQDFGIKWITWKQSMIDMATDLYALEKLQA